MWYIPLYKYLNGKWKGTVNISWLNKKTEASGKNLAINEKERDIFMSFQIFLKNNLCVISIKY